MNGRVSVSGAVRAGVVLLLALPILWCLWGCAQGEVLVADLQAQAAGEVYQAEAGYRIGEDAGVVPDFVRLFPITLKPGIYRVVIDYSCSGQRTNTIRTSLEGESGHALLENAVGLFSGLEQMDFLVWLKEGTDSFAVHVDYAGQGELTVRNIRLCRTNRGSICLLIILTALYLAAGVWLWWKRRCQDKESLRRGKIVLLVIAGVTAVSSLPLAVDYNLGGADMGFHLLRIEGLLEGLKSGQIPVRIQPQWLYGHGYAVSVFYCDTFLFFPALLRMAGFTVLSAYRIYMLLVNLTTAWLAYFCFKRFAGSRSTGLLGSALYTLAPYRLYNMYIRNAVGEYTAMLFLPVICLGFWMIFRGEKRAKEEKRERGWLVLALGFTGIIQSHVITCELAAGFAVLLCAVLWRRFCKKEVFLAIVKAAAATILLNLWYLLPFTEYFLKENLVFHHTAARTIQERGLYPAHLFYMWTRHGENEHFNESGMAGTVPVTVGAALLICMVLFLYWRMHAKPEERESGTYRVAKVSLLLGCVAMLCSLHMFPWDALQRSNRIFAGLISNIQFPMRFLAIATVCLCVHGCAVGRLLLEWKRGRQSILIIGCVIAVAVVSGMFYTNDMLFSRTNVLRLYTAENMGNGAILGAEYLPWGTEQSLLSYEDMQIGQGVSVEEWQKKYLDMRLICANEGEDSYIDCPMLYYRGYQALDADSGTSLQVTGGYNGLVRVRIPAGFQGEIRVWFAGKWYWHLAEVVSLAAAAGLALMAVKVKYGQKLTEVYRRRKGR